jgi:hypothetical protein
MVEGMLAIFPGVSITGLVEAHIGPDESAAKVSGFFSYRKARNRYASPHPSGW